MCCRYTSCYVPHSDPIYTNVGEEFVAFRGSLVDDEVCHPEAAFIKNVGDHNTFKKAAISGPQCGL